MAERVTITCDKCGIPSTGLTPVTRFQFDDKEHLDCCLHCFRGFLDLHPSLKEEKELYEIAYPNGENDSKNKLVDIMRPFVDWSQFEDNNN